MMNNYDLINSQVHIEDVISNEVTLKRSGTSRKGLCPFHDERTPSFTVYPQQNRFHCFGCEATGDVIDYVMKIKGFASSVEAMEHIAYRHNLHLTDIDTETIHRKKERVQSNRKAFAPQFKQVDQAKEYLKERGFTDDTLIKETFHLGYDSKEHAVVIPFFNEYGELVGRTYRYLSEDAQPKYKNSAEDEVFRKNELLFGFDKARKEINRKLYLVEGYFDCMAMYQMGVGQTAAYASAHITEGHAQLLARHLDKHTTIYLIPDNDNAGKKAVKKNSRVLKKHLKNRISVIKLPDDVKDMNDYMLSGRSFEALTSEAYEKYMLKEDLDDCLELEDEYEVAKEWAARTMNPIIRFSMAEELARRWNKPFDLINNFMEGEGEINTDNQIFTATESFTEFVNFTQSDLPKINFGIYGLDNAIRAINPKEVVFVMGKSGSAKTSFIINWIYNIVLKQNINTLFSSLELPKEMIIPQLLQIHKNEPMHKIEKMARDGVMDEEAADLLMKMDERFRIADKDSQSLEEIENYVKTVNDDMLSEPIQILFVDYFQYVKMRNNVSRYEAASEAAREFKAMAKRLNIAIVVLTQVNRASGGGGYNKLSMESAKETGAIEESSDYVLGLSRPVSDPDMDEEEKLERQHEMWCQILKARWGPTVDVPLHFDGMTKRITDGEGKF